MNERVSTRRTIHFAPAKCFPRESQTILAIPFAHCEVVSSGERSSIVGLSAYITRSMRNDVVSSENYNFSSKADDLEHCEVMLPTNAPAHLEDGSELWNAATQAELTLDRKNKTLRFKTNAQLAKAIVLALPKELAPAEQVKLMRDFCTDNFVKYGVAVEFAIHSPATGDENYHAHVLVSTRLSDATNCLGNAFRFVNQCRNQNVNARAIGHT